MSSEKNVLTNATRNALKSMKSAGFEISNRLRVIVDPESALHGIFDKKKQRRCHRGCR